MLASHLFDLFKCPYRSLDNNVPTTNPSPLMWIHIVLIIEPTKPATAPQNAHISRDK